MVTKKAIERIAWRFGQGKAFKPNEGDMTALNQVIKFYNDSETTVSLSQEPFAKMYLFMYLNLLQNRDLDGVDVLPARLLRKALDTPMSILIEDINNHVESINLSAFFSDYISCDKIERDMSDEEIALHKEEVKSIPVGELEKHLKERISPMELSNKLITHVNQILDAYVPETTF